MTTWILQNDYFPADYWVETFEYFPVLADPVAVFPSLTTNRLFRPSREDRAYADAGEARIRVGEARARDYTDAGEARYTRIAKETRELDVD